MIIYRPLTLCVPQFLEAPLDLEALGLSLYSLKVNPALLIRWVNHGDQLQLESSWLFPLLRLGSYFHFWLCGTFYGNIYNFSFFWCFRFFNTNFRHVFWLVLDDLIFYIKSSWIPKNLSVDPWGSMDPQGGNHCPRTPCAQKKLVRAVLTL